MTQEHFLTRIELLLKSVQLLDPSRHLLSFQDLLTGLEADANGAYLEFDTESIPHRLSYLDLAPAFERAFSQTDRIDLKLEFPGGPDGHRVLASASINGLSFTREWTQSDDWVADEFFALIADIEKRSSGKLCSLMVDQDYRALYVPHSEIGDELNRLFKGLTDAELGIAAS